MSTTHLCTVSLALPPTDICEYNIITVILQGANLVNIKYGQ